MVKIRYSVAAVKNAASGKRPAALSAKRLPSSDLHFCRSRESAAASTMVRYSAVTVTVWNCIGNRM